MIRLAAYFLVPCIVVLLLFRIGGAVSIHDDATIVASHEVCRVSNTPMASGDPSTCKIVADVKRTFVHENYLLRIADGTVIEVPREWVHGLSYQRCYYSLSW